MPCGRLSWKYLVKHFLGNSWGRPFGETTEGDILQRLLEEAVWGNYKGKSLVEMIQETINHLEVVLCMNFPIYLTLPSK